MADHPVIQSKYDASVIKQTLDDIVVEVCNETYKEDSTQLWVSSGLGIASILLATWGQFKVPFPQSSILLLVIVIINVIITGLIQLYMHITGPDTLFTSKPSSFRPNSIIVASSMERYSMNYAVHLKSKSNPTITESLTKPANNFIRVDGVVDKQEFSSHLREALRKLEANMSQKKN